MSVRIMCAAALAAAVAAVAAPANAAELVLKFATLDSPMAHLNVHIHHPWAKHLNEIGKGVVRIDVRDGHAVANHGNVYNRVLDDVVQIGWGLQSSSPGKFKLSEVVSLPFVSDKSVIASPAFWRLYKSGALDTDFDQVVALKLNVFPQSNLQFRTKPPTIENLEGMKIAITGGDIAANMVKSMGGAPLSFRPNELYEVMQRGTADGMVIGWTAFQPFKLAEVSTYHLEMPLGGNGGMVFMSKKKWAALPAAVRKILADNATEKESREYGAFWDRVKQEGRDKTAAMGGHTIVTPDQALLAKWQTRMAPITENWIKNTPGGDKVYRSYKELLAKIGAES